MYEYLEEFHRANGHCKVPSKGNRKLSDWCNAQKYRLYSKQMNGEEEALLVLLGFNFDFNRRGMNKKVTAEWNLRCVLDSIS